MRVLKMRHACYEVPDVCGDGAERCLRVLRGT